MKNAKKYICVFQMIVLSLFTLAAAQKWTTYTVANGLASNSVISVAIDAQSNKWFGTQGSGVSKFDGVQWTTYNISNSDLAGKNGLGNYVGAIAVDLEGSKWFGGGTMGNYGVSKFAGTTWTTYTNVNGLAGNYVTAIAVDKQGNKWFGTQGNGVSKYDGTTWTNFTVSNGLIGNWVNAIAIDKQGNKWFGARTYDTHGLIPSGGVSKFNDTNWTNYDTSKGLAGIFVSSIAFDGQGNKWFGTYGGGVSKFDGTTWTSYTTKNGLVSNKVIAVAIDRQGNKWFGTEGSGASRFDNTTWTTYSTASGSAGNCLAGNVVYGIAIDNLGNKWFGTSDGGVSKYEDTAQPVQPPLTAYNEGIDTTDINGYGLDSAFQVNANGNINPLVSFASYFFQHGEEGLFNYSFNDIKMAAESGSLSPYNPFPTIYTCFIAKKKDNTYSKVHILNKTPDNRYVFQYGANSTPNDRMLMRVDYDRSLRYKPNNLQINFCYCLGSQIHGMVTWDPPLPNDNHLLGYILYQNSASVDTIASINLAEWAPVAITDSTSIPNSLSYGRYVNIVAAYTEGNSDFLQGWTYYAPSADGANKFCEVSGKTLNKIDIRKSPNGFLINLQLSRDKTPPLPLAVYNITGRRLAHFSITGNAPVFFNALSLGLAEGLYIIRAELPDHTVLTQPFMFTK